MTGEITVNQFSGIKALYHLDDTSDSSGNGYTLTNTGGAAFSLGMFNNAVDFGPSNNSKYLHVANNMGISNGSITMMCWLKIHAAIGASQWIFLHHTDATTKVAYSFGYQYNSGTPRILVDRTRRTVADDFVAKTITLDPATWYHFALTYDGTNIKGYLDGTGFGSASASGDGSGTYTTTGQYIGVEINNSDIAASHFAGFIDEVYIGNSVLTDKQIKDYYIWSRNQMGTIA